MIRFACACGNQLVTREAYANRQMKCPVCDAFVTVPAASLDREEQHAEPPAQGNRTAAPITTRAVMPATHFRIKAGQDFLKFGCFVVAVTGVALYVCLYSSDITLRIAVPILGISLLHLWLSRMVLWIDFGGRVTVRYLWRTCTYAMDEIRHVEFGRSKMRIKGLLRERETRVDRWLSIDTADKASHNIGITTDDELKALHVLHEKVTKHYDPEWFADWRERFGETWQNG
jgi:hypothetical protein